jgi:hypothetical protein
MQKFALVIVAAIALSSCATIFGSTSTLVGVDTDPQGATVKITNRKGNVVYEGQTPATVSLKNSNGYFQRGIYQVDLSMEGCQTHHVTISAHLNGWYFGNVLIGGALGMLIIDPLTGAMYKLDQKFVREKMTPKTAAISSPGDGNGLKIYALRDVPADWQGHLQKLP